GRPSGNWVNSSTFPALKSVRENSVVPPGLESFFPLFPALKRWAKFGRPSGAAFSCAWFHQTGRKRVLTHALERWAKFGRPSGAGSRVLLFHMGWRENEFSRTHFSTSAEPQSLVPESRPTRRAR